jgi:MFS family permease
MTEGGPRSFRWRERIFRLWGFSRGLDRRVYLLSSANLVRSVGRSAVWIFLPLLLYEGYHYSYFQIGLLIGVIVPISTAVNILGGSLSDQFGRRRLASLPGFGVGLCMFLLYFEWNHGVALLMGLWALSTILMNLQRPAQNAMIGDVSAPHQRVAAFGVVRVFNNLGFSISPALGGVVATEFGLSIIFVVAGFASLGESLLLAIFLVESFEGTHRPANEEARPGTPPPNLRETLRGPLGDRFLLAFGLLGVGLTLATQQFGTALALFAKGVQGLSLEQVGFLYSVNGLFVVLLQIPISGLLRDRPLGWMAVGTLLYGGSFLIFLEGGAYLADLVGVMVLTLGEDIVSPLQNSILADRSRPQDRGSYFGVYSLYTNISQTFAPFLGTLLLGLPRNGPLFLWGGTAVLAVVVATGYLRLETRLESSGKNPLSGSPS